jgi:iron complex outermembrane receptor protein
MRFLSIELGLLLAVASPALALANDPPPALEISGRVTNEQGAPLAEVRVIVLELNRTTTTGPDGQYRFTELASGQYHLSYSLIGYGPQEATVVLKDQNLTLDLTMKVSLVELPPIQVTSTPTASAVLNSPQPTAVLSGEDLHSAQAPSLGETLNGVAGVHSWSTGVGIGKPVIRGLTANRVLVLDDGQRLETQQWGDEHGPNIETENAERIEVIRGPASVLYGSDALGGVVNVIPPPIPDAIGRSGFAQSRVSVAYGTNNRQPDGALLIEGASGGFGARADISGRTSQDVRTPNYVLWNSGDEAIGGSAALGYRGTWGSVSGTFTQRNEKIEMTDEDPTATGVQRMSDSRARLDANLPLGNSVLEMTGGYERNRRREFEDAVTTDVALGLLSETWTAAARWHHSPLGPLHGILGISGLTTGFDKFGEETLIPNNRANSLGVYAFEQLETGRWRLSGGLRYDYRNLKVEDDTVIGVTAQTRTYNSITGNLGALYKVAEPVALVFNVGRGFRAPSSFELFSNGVHEGTVAFERGDSTLKNETSVNTDLAIRVQSSRVAAELGGFVNWVQNYIYSFPTGQIDPGSGFEIYDFTQGNARLTGFEAAVQYHPTKILHLQGTADYVWAQNTSTNNPLPNIPPFRATYFARLEGGGQRWFQSPYFLVGGETNAAQTRLDPAEAVFFSQAFGGAGYRSEGYTLVNLGAGFSLFAGKTPVHFDFTLKNAFNQAYANFLSRIKTNAMDPGMGRTLVMRVTTEFK